MLQRIAYLNAGTFGPLARPVADALVEAVEHDAEYGRSGLPYFEQTVALRDDARQAFASLVDADPAQVALTSSTTEGCAIVVRGLGLEPGDEVVTTTDEHFGLLGPLGASPATVVVVEPDPDAIRAAVTSRTRLIASSPVLWTTGAVLPLAELGAETGVPVLADGAQAVGAIPTTADGLDFLTISGQKWLCGPDATGALVVRDPERIAVTSPSYFAQTGHDPDGAYEPQAGARRLEPGWWSQGTLRAMLAALSLRPAWGFERAWEAAERCRELLSGRVEVVTPADRATLVSFRPDGEEPADVVSRLARGRRPRPGAPGPRARPRLVRLVDERRRPRPPRRRPRRLSARLRGVGGGAEPELAGDRLQRRDDVRDVLVELQPDQLRARVDLVAVHAGREGRLLELLPHRLRLEAFETGRPHEPARVDEAGQLVTGEERLLELRLARQLEVLRVRQHRPDHDLRVALLAEDRRSVLRMLVERGVNLVVEVVEQRDTAPQLLVLARAPRVSAHRRLDRERMAEERLALRVAGQRRPGPVAGDLHGAGYDTAPLCSRS